MATRRVGGMLLMVLCLLAVVLGDGIAAVRPSSPKGKDGRCLLHVITVGVNDFPNIHRSLLGAEADARDIADLFQRAADGERLSGSRVYLLLGGQATFKLVEDAFSRVAAEMDADDAMVFHYSGIGDSNRLHLFDSEKDGNRTVDPELLGQWSKSLPSPLQFYLLDADGTGPFLQALTTARSGRNSCTIITPGWGHSVEAMGPTIANYARLLGLPGAPSAGDVTGSAIDASGPSSGGTPYGALSWLASRGLEGHADLDGDQFVTSAELGAFVLRAAARINESMLGLAVACGTDFPLRHAPNSGVLQARAAGRGFRLSSAQPDSLPPPDAGKRYALLAGVEKYTEEGYRNLPNARNDVLALRDVLVAPGPGGVPRENVRILLDEAPADGFSHGPPTDANLEEQLNWLAANARKEDTVWIFFAGHGDRFAERTYLLTSGFHKGSFRTTALSATAFNDMVRDIPAQRKIVVLDCCHSGGVHEAARGSGSASEEVVKNLSEIAEGEIRFLSCKVEEQSLEMRSGPNGIFTHSLVEALRGEADANGDRAVTWPELETFVKDVVRLRAYTDWQQRQNPVADSRTSGVFVMSRLPAANPAPNR